MGASINDQFSRNPEYNLFGVATGTTGFTQFPSGTAKLVRFKAHPSNVGIFELAAQNDEDAGNFPFSAGDDSGWVAAPYNAQNGRGLQNFVYRNASGSSDYLHYWIQR